MQRPSLHLLPERASRHRARMRLRGAAIPLLAPRRRGASEQHAPEQRAQELPTPEASERPAVERPTADLDARRVREAGGPRDEASYACACGYLFAAAVSTSVECPHCGAGQAW